MFPSLKPAQSFFFSHMLIHLCACLFLFSSHALTEKQVEKQNKLTHCIPTLEMQFLDSPKLDSYCTCLAQTWGILPAYHSSYDFCVASEAATLAISTLLAFRGWCLIHYRGKISHPSQAAAALTCQCQGGCKRVTDGCQSPALYQDTDMPSVSLP